ncbi:MAG: PDZ domain-containing protein, partial [Chloroflexi bacterium]|nr:PDZ domain-containing protein [Chloroflexota bacterium]
MRNPLIRRGALALAVTMFAGGVALPATSVRAAEPDAPGVVATDAVQAQALAYLGVGIVELTKPLAQQLDLSRSNGVVVLKLAKDGPAQKAGVQVKDIITRLADTEIKKTGEVHSFLAGKKAGDKIAVTILRQGQPNPFKIEVTLGSYPMTTMPVETKPVVTKPEPS